jgi:general secretion pathway protein C
MIEQILKYFWIVTILFLVAAAILAAQLTSDLVARNLWVAEVGEDPVAVVGVAPVERESLRDYRVIEQRNLFNANPKPVVPEPVRRSDEAPSPVAPPPVPVVPLNLTLIGTVVIQGGQSLAVIELDNEVKVVRENQPVAEGATLAKVLADRIRVDRSGKMEEFLLYPPESAQRPATRIPTRRTRSRPAPAAPAEPDTADSTDTIRSVGEDKWLIDSREVEEATANMSRLMTQVRVVPNFTDGQSDGFKVFAIRPGSLFAKIGLQNGDVIKRINGVELSGVEQAMEAYQQLKDETAIQIDLSRRDENRSFSYEIR